jgi:transcriptional regulator with XRE-family HTH domain
VSTKQTATLTPDQSRAARRELALSQRDTITQTGIQAYKLKQFEAGSFRPDMATLKKLRDFYEGQGVNFDDLDAYLNGQGADASDGAGDDVGAPKLKPGYTMNPRPGFFISSDLPPEVVDKLMSDMEASDDRIADIIKGATKKGMFSDLSEETEGQIQELFGHLAMNHLRFRCLQGRNIIEPTRNEGKTVGDHLAQWVDGRGVFMPNREGQEAPKVGAGHTPDAGQTSDEEQE